MKIARGEEGVPAGLGMLNKYVPAIVTTDCESHSEPSRPIQSQVLWFLMCFKALAVLVLSRKFQQGKENYQFKPEETELVASRSIKAVIISTNSITYFQSRGSSTMWGCVYCSVVLITEDSMVGETITWNQKTLTQILFLVLHSCPTSLSFGLCMSEIQALIQISKGFSKAK